MNVTSALRRVWVPISVFGLFVLFGATLAAVGGGRDGFLWMLTHGICGPLGNLLLHDGRLSVVDLLVAIAVVVAVAVRCVHPPKWTTILSVIAVVSWIIMGWGVGV